MDARLNFRGNAIAGKLTKQIATMDKVVAESSPPATIGPGQFG